MISPFGLRQDATPPLELKNPPQVVLLFFTFIIFIYGDNANIFLKYKFMSRWKGEIYFEFLNFSLIEAVKIILKIYILVLLE